MTTMWGDGTEAPPRSGYYAHEAERELEAMTATRDVRRAAILGQRAQAWATLELAAQSARINLAADNR